MRNVKLVTNLNLVPQLSMPTAYFTRAYDTCTPTQVSPTNTISHIQSATHP